MRTTLLAVGLFLGCGMAAAAPPAVIGIFEETAADGHGALLVNDIRIGRGNRWLSAGCERYWLGRGKPLESVCPNLPEPPGEWTIFEDGKVAGTALTSGLAEANSIAGTGALKIAGGRLPKAEGYSAQYGGWTGFLARKPLLARNGDAPGFVDRWSDAGGHREMLGDIWTMFSLLVPQVHFCKPDREGQPEYHNRATRPGDVQALGSWQSNSGEMLLKFGIDPKIGDGCEINEFPSVWFYRDASGALRPLPSQIWEGLINGSPGLWPLAFGDFDGDGGEEALFQFGAYNRDGYILYYNHFRKYARVSWSYH